MLRDATVTRSLGVVFKFSIQSVAPMNGDDKKFLTCNGLIEDDIILNSVSLLFCI